MFERKLKIEKAKVERPACCPEKNCECLWCGGGVESLDMGYSCICFGRMKEKKLFFKANKVVHENDYFLCVWTPFRGWAKFTTNDGDMDSFRHIIRVWEEMKGGLVAIETDEGQATLNEVPDRLRGVISMIENGQFGVAIEHLTYAIRDLESDK